MSFKSFSQKITLSEKQAKAIAVDLVKGEACAEELTQTKTIVDILENKVAFKDKVISNLEKQKKVFQEKDTIREEQIRSQEVIISATEQSLKKSNRKTNFYKITTLAAIITGGTLLILK